MVKLVMLADTGDAQVWERLAVRSSDMCCAACFMQSVKVDGKVIHPMWKTDGRRYLRKSGRKMEFTISRS